MVAHSISVRFEEKMTFPGHRRVVIYVIKKTLAIFFLDFHFLNFNNIQLGFILLILTKSSNKIIKILISKCDFI
ncbi:MAG: hypothetical protein A2X49_07015 [Lentisphaerae bacterium GWF2_52_8]|nr:MAG: hypothetical protein A2X49_07015 [Lentisphaerae bacterium GWF2_52_8]